MATDLSPAIEAIWQRSRPEIARRIATLQEAVAAQLAGDLDDDLRARADSDAHKLAGSLGMFGFATGSELAREIEQALDAGDRLVGCAGPRLGELVSALSEEFDLRSGHAVASDDPREPAAGQPPEAIAPGGPATDALPRHTRPRGGAWRVLVIDDSALIRGVVQAGLGGEPGWRVIAAPSGAEGLELAAREMPDAILLDVEMPGLDGPATLARLRTHEAVREIPVLFLTGHCTAQDRRRLEALGAAGVIAKPFDPARLGFEIGRLLGWPP